MANQTKLVHRQLLLAKAEVTYGVDSAPTNTANSILVQNVSYSETGLRMAKRPALRGNSIAALQDVYAGQLRDLSFECEVKGSGAAGTVPEIDPLLQACGMSETTVASTSCTYAPNSNSATMGSATIYLYLDGSVMKLAGARGTVSFEMKTGGLVLAKFKFTGHIESDYTDVALPAGTFNATVPVAALNIAATVGAYSPTLDSFTFNTGNKLDNPPALGATDGYGQIIITDRMPTVTLDPQLDTEADYNWFGNLTAGTLAAVTTGVIGTTAGNRVQFSLPYAYVMKVTSKDRNGIICADVELGAVEGGGSVDNDYSIVFT